MGSPYDFTQLFQPVQYPEQRDTGFQDYFGNYQNIYQPRERDYFFDMNDPEVQKYQEMSARPPASKSFIEDYLSRRPSLEEYNPSLGRKIGSFLLGTLSGLNNPVLARENAARVRMDPFASEMADWQGEGANIVQRAKALDEAQKNELLAQKFGLTERAKAAIAARNDRNRALTGGTSFARGQTGAQAAQDRIDADKAKFDWNQLFKTLSLQALINNRNAQDVDRDRALDLREQGLDRTSAHDEKLNDPVEIQNQQNAAMNLSLQEIRDHPQLAGYKPILDAMREAVARGDDPRLGIDEAPVHESIKKAFRSYLDFKIKNYMDRR